MYKVLIADDEEHERSGLDYLIKQRAYPVQTYMTCNGQEALDFLRDKRMDVLITDIKMPLKDGLTLCAEAQRLYPDIHLLISSAYGDFEYTQKAIRIKVDDYILKPVVVDHFHRIMERVLASLRARDSEQEKQRDFWKSYRAANPLERDKMVRSLLDSDQPGAQGDADGKTAGHYAINQVLELIHSNYSGEISLEWLANQVYLSPGYLSCLFQQTTGKSVTQYITACRMEKARELLATTNMRIGHIAKKVGIQNASYFCLLFRKAYGVTAISMREDAAHLHLQ